MKLTPPWAAISDAGTVSTIEVELRREIADGHLLAAEPVTAVARREDQDDVLFALAGGRWAIVHLTWRGSRESDSRWPRAELFSSEADLTDRLRADGLEFAPERRISE